MQAHDHSAPAFLPHGFCYLWDPHLLWTHVAADFLIGAAYVTIALSLAWLVHRVRSDIPFSWAFVAFGLFIITCGLTHFMEIWTLWQPVYWLSGGVKVVTAVASVATAVAMPFTVPKAVATVRDARLAREREVAEARAVALEEQNDILRAQTIELEEQREEAQALARKLDLANSELRRTLRDAEEAQHAAESADLVKTTFLRTMSHELRTPLNAIIGYTQLLEMQTAGPLVPQQVKQLGRITHSAHHLLGLIDDVITLAQSGESATPLVDRFSLRAVVADVAAMMEPAAGARQLELTIGDVPDREMVSDERWLRQILLNLVSNAVKFTERGSVRVRAEVDDATVRIEVADTGIGIGAEHHGSIFKPFWQAQQGTTRGYGGSGLGLAVSRELARRLGGDITLGETTAQGTTFVVELPLEAPRPA